MGNIRNFCLVAHKSGDIVTSRQREPHERAPALAAGAQNRAPARPEIAAD